VRSEFRRFAARAGVRRRFAPHQLRHAHALELAGQGVALNIIQRQLGHANLGTTSIYLQGIAPEEIIMTVHMRRAPMISASGPAAMTETQPPAGAPRRSRSAMAKRASDATARTSGPRPEHQALASPRLSHHARSISVARLARRLHSAHAGTAGCEPRSPLEP
jgi:hypothetical protein